MRAVRLNENSTVRDRILPQPDPFGYPCIFFLSKDSLFFNCLLSRALGFVLPLNHDMTSHLRRTIPVTILSVHIKHGETVLRKCSYHSFKQLKVYTSPLHHEKVCV